MICFAREITHSRSMIGTHTIFIAMFKCYSGSEQDHKLEDTRVEPRVYNGVRSRKRPTSLALRELVHETMWPNAQTT